MPLKAEEKVVQRGDGFARGDLTALYANSLGFVMEASREFRKEDYLTAYLLQFGHVWCIVMLCFEQSGEETISGSVRNGRGLTSAQSMLSRPWQAKIIVRTHTLVQVSTRPVLGGRVQALRLDTGPPTVNSSQVSLLMAPRQRGVPRRGGVWGISRRQEVQARAIQPLAMVAPPSSPSEESDQLDSQVHTSRFTFRCRRNQSRVSLLITVIATEEEDEDSDSQEEDDGELAQTGNAQARAEIGNVVIPPPGVVNPEEHALDLGSLQQPAHPPDSRQPVNEDATMPDFDNKA